MAAGRIVKVRFDHTEDGSFGLVDEDMPYRHVHFPKVMYHPTLAPKTVKSKESMEKLGKEWKEVPIRPQDGDTRDPPEEE